MSWFTSGYAVPFARLISILQNIPKDDRHELIKCKEYLKESEARREELDLRIDANRAALFVLRKNGERNVERCARLLHVICVENVNNNI